MAVRFPDSSAFRRPLSRDALLPMSSYCDASSIQRQYGINNEIMRSQMKTKVATGRHISGRLYHNWAGNTAAINTRLHHSQTNR